MAQGSGCRTRSGTGEYYPDSNPFVLPCGQARERPRYATEFGKERNREVNRDRVKILDEYLYYGKVFQLCRNV